VTPRDVLAGATTIAVVGLSRDPGKAAHAVPRALAEAGYRVLPVHPRADELLGQPVHRRLSDISEHVDLVDVFRPAPEAPDIARQAVAIGADALWLQLGITSPEARRIAEEAGMAYVEDECAAVVLSRYGLTKRGERT
jgi:predicted CoA-binding protein